MINIDTCDRADLEIAAVEAGFCDTSEGCDRVAAMSEDELREALAEWIEAGDECAGCC